MKTAEHTTRLRGLWSSTGLGDVESLMLRLVGDKALATDPLGAVWREHLATGGKRIRARLALSTADALGASRDVCVPWAASCELLHNASLIHDDLQDGDTVRRNHPTVWSQHGAAQAINAGDLGLMLPYSCIDHLDTDDAKKWRLSRILARESSFMVRGQASELVLLNRRLVDRQSYHDSVQGKTAALFALPVIGAAMLSGMDEAKAHAIGDAFRDVGVLFQIQDDLLDIVGDKGRGQQGSDLFEGKISALVVEHLRLHPEDKAWMIRILSLPREETPVEHVELIIEKFRNEGAVDAVWSWIADIEDNIEACQALIDCPRMCALATELMAMSLTPVAKYMPSDVRR